MKDIDLSVNERVSVARWDRHERPANKLRDPAVVLAIERRQCESGFMVTVRGASGETQTLDRNWLKKITP